MRKLIVAIFFVMVFTVSAHAYEFAENWTKTDTAWQATFLTLTTMDWIQTRWMVKQNFHWDGEYYHETNPILGDYPSLKAVDTYIPLAMLAHTVVAMAIPDTTLRRIWQCVWIGLESASVYKNYSLGVRLEF